MVLQAPPVNAVRPSQSRTPLIKMRRRVMSGSCRLHAAACFEREHRKTQYKSWISGISLGIAVVYRNEAASTAHVLHSFTVLLHCCITALLYYCIAALLRYCGTVVLYTCVVTLLLLYYCCIAVLLYYKFVLLYYRLTVLL